MPRPWPTTVGMTHEQLVTEVVCLRSENSNLRRTLDMYRQKVAGMRGATAAFNALVNGWSDSEDGER